MTGTNQPPGFLAAASKPSFVTNVFSDNTKDPDNRMCTNWMAPFRIDANNNANNYTPA